MSHCQHLRIKERESILKFSSEGMGIRAIGLALGRNAATISRELRRNRTPEQIASRTKLENIAYYRAIYTGY